MFEKLSEQEVLERLNQRKAEIKNLDKLPSLDKFYLSFISKYESIGITPDIEIFGYEEALKENRYLETNFSNINQIVWMIGRTGQGDEWFINKENSSVLFYDHNQGEYSNIKQFVSFNISFLEFLQMAFLYQELENLLDEQEEIDKNQINTFIEVINSIHPNLYEFYPFKYF
jgi:hypothetical protein